jgi:hypothetical protein
MGIASAHYSLPPWQAFQPSVAARRRCLLPASATDLQHEHPQIARFPGAWLTPCRPPVALTHVQSDSAASDPLAESRPRVDTCLTARFQLQANRAQPCPEEGPSTAPGDAASRRRFQPPARLFGLPFDTLCHTPPAPEAETSKALRAIPSALSSTSTNFPARGVFHRQVLPKEPATVLAA